MTTPRACKFGLTYIFSFAALLLSVPGMAGVIFQDDFNSGNLLKTLNGAAFWTNNSSSFVQPGASGPSTITVKPESTLGEFSVRALYAGSADLTADARPELRFNLGGQYSELWVSFKVYVPQNYYHRIPIGSGNNKFFILYGDDNKSALFVDFEAWPRGQGDGSDRIGMQWGYDGVNRGWKYPPTDWTLGAPEDRGKWHYYVFYYKLGTSAGANDGLVRAWKNGRQVLNIENLPNYPSSVNYFKKGYIFGASNSGFNVDTELRLDDITFSTDPLGVDPPNEVRSPAVQ